MTACTASHVIDYHDRYPSPEAHQYRVNVPYLPVGDERRVVVYVSHASGGAVGRPHKGRWAYAVTVDGKLTAHGTGLFSDIPETHDDAVRNLFALLADGIMCMDENLCRVFSMYAEFGAEESV